MIRPYHHRVNYYETDKMGIVYHGNYIHWMEESRISLLEQLGWPYERMEQQGIISPVKAVRINYVVSTTFPDEIEILPVVKAFDGVVLTVAYTMRKAGTETTVCTAESDHVFLNPQGRFIRMKRDFPELYNVLTAQIGSV